MNDKWITVKNFHHDEGMHCESTALRDHINHLGFEFSEAMIFGLDATMGFAYFGKWADESGLLIGGKSGSITEKSLACRILGINMEKCNFSNPDLAWRDSKDAIDKGLPLLVMVDMGCLPYFKWEEEFHFGGHSISLMGYNEGLEMALVYDNNFKDPIKVPLLDLKKARNSKGGTKFLWPMNVRYILNNRPDGKRPPLGAGFKLALQKTSKNMLAASMSHNGIQGMGKFADSIRGWRKGFEGNPGKARNTLEMLYGYIEDYGTGGALFRNLFVQFLKEISNRSKISEGKRPWKDSELDLLNDNLHFMENSAKKWTKFAQMLKMAVDGSDSNPAAGLDYEALESIIRKIINLEKKFFTNINGIRL